jgi:hypothetical protein
LASVRTAITANEIAQNGMVSRSTSGLPVRFHAQRLST